MAQYMVKEICKPGLEFLKLLSFNGKEKAAKEEIQGLHFK